MKKISMLALVLVFIGTVSHADQKKEADKAVEKQGSSSSFIKPETAPKMTAETADGDCPRIG